MCSDLLRVYVRWDRLRWAGRGPPKREDESDNNGRMAYFFLLVIFRWGVGYVEDWNCRLNCWLKWHPAPRPCADRIAFAVRPESWIGPAEEAATVADALFRMCRRVVFSAAIRTKGVRRRRRRRRDQSGIIVWSGVIVLGFCYCSGWLFTFALQLTTRWNGTSEWSF